MKSTRMEQFLLVKWLIERYVIERVYTVTKTDKFNHKTDHNTACNRDNMCTILALWGVFGVGQ